MAHYWGNRFNLGGLAGYCHGGITGVEAVLHHIPTSEDTQHLIIYSGPHIGYHDGDWGKVLRIG